MSFIPEGIPSLMRATSWRTAAESSSGFATACLITPMLSDGLPLKREIVRSSIAPIATEPTSRMRTGKPATFATMMPPNCSGVCRSVSATTVNSRAWDSIRPAGISAFWRRIASSTSCTVSR